MHSSTTRQMVSRKLNAAGPFFQICVTQSLTIETTAEGVEAEKQLDRCVEGSTEVQGFEFSVAFCCILEGAFAGAIGRLKPASG